MAIDFIEYRNCRFVMPRRGKRGKKGKERRLKKWAETKSLVESRVERVNYEGIYIYMTKLNDQKME